jgi:hypothetical protein
VVAWEQNKNKYVNVNTAHARGFVTGAFFFLQFCEYLPAAEGRKRLSPELTHSMHAAEEGSKNLQRKNAKKVPLLLCTG